MAWCRPRLARKSSPLVISRALAAGPFGAAHGFDAGERRVGLSQCIQVTHDLRHRCGDVVDVLIIANQQELRKPNGLVISRALRNRAADSRVIAAKLRAILGSGVEQIAAIHGLVKAAIARNAFGFDSRHKKITRDVRALGPVLKYVTVDGVARDGGLRRKSADAGNGVQYRAE